MCIYQVAWLVLDKGSPSFSSLSLFCTRWLQVRIVLGAIPEWNVREGAEATWMGNGVTQRVGYEVHGLAATFELGGVCEGVDLSFIQMDGLLVGLIAKML